MGKDAPAPQTSESTREMMEAFTQTMPGFMQAMNSQIGPAAQAQLDVAKNTSPAYAQLTQDLYAKYAPQLAGVGRDIDAANRLKAGETDAQILDTSGRKLAQTYKEIDSGLNPEYYKARQEAGGKLSELLSSINLNDANPEAERLVNQENARSGNLNNANATNTVSNALSFGDQMAKRRGQLSEAINVASGFLQPSNNSAFNPATAALNRPTSSTGLSQFGGVDKSGGEAYTSGNNLMGSIGSMREQENQINANRRDTLDRMNEVTSSL